MTFDIDQYLATKVSSAIVDEKLKQVQAATAAKVAQLQDTAAKGQVPVDNSSSWSEKLGLEPESFLSNRVNDVASLTSGASRLVGQVASLPVNVLAMAVTAKATKEDYNAYNRVKTGTATEDDMALLNRPISPETSRTIISGFRDAEKLRGTSRDLNNYFDLHKIVDSTNRDALATDLGDEFSSNWSKITGGWDAGKHGEFAKATGGIVSGMAGLLLNAGEAVVTNPSAAREYIIENVPQLFVGALGKTGQAAMAASNMGYAADYYQQGIEKYAKENGGQLPPEDQRQRMSVLAASLALAEHAGDHTSLAFMKKGGTDLTTGLAASVRRTSMATAEGFGSESATEGYQTWAEGEVSGQPATAKDIYTGAVIGGVAGAGLTGGGHAVAEAVGATPQAQAKQKEAAATAGTFKSAAEANDPSPYLDPKSPDYDLSKGMGVLVAHAMKDDTTPEVKVENLKKAGELLSKLEEQHAAAKNEADTFSPASIAEAKAEIAKHESELAAVPKTDTETIAKITDRLDGWKEVLADAQDSKAAEKANTVLSRVERQLNTGRTYMNSLASMNEQVVSSDEVNTLVTEANKPESASKLVVLSMIQPEALPAATALKLAEDKTNALTDEQRAHLRVFSEARQAENAVSTQSKVTQEVMFGSDKNVGLAQYRQYITNAISSGAKVTAERQLAQLDKFATGHADKAMAARRALKQGLGTQITFNETARKWEVHPAGTFDAKTLRKNGGLAINSARLVQDMGTEAAALRAAHTELNSATSLKFGVQSGSPKQAVVPSGNINIPQMEEDTARPAVPSGDNSSSATTPAPAKSKLEQGSERIAKQEAVVKAAEDAIAKRKADKAAQAAAPSNSSPAASPASTPASPSLADARGATASSSAAAAETSPENSAKPAAAESQAASEAKAAPATEAATAEAEKANTAPIGLKVFATKVKDLTGLTMQEIYRKVNPVAQFLTQKMSSERYKTDRPLVVVADFMTAIKNKTVSPYSFIEEGEKASYAQKTAIKSAYSHLREWLPIIAGNIKEHSGNVDFKSEDMLQYLVENGAVEENVLTSIGYAAYSWTLGEANSPAYKTANDIAQMHGKEKDSYVSPAGEKALRHMAGYEDRIIHQLGDAAIQALGFQAGLDAPQDILPKLRMALGTHALLLLEEQGMIKREALDQKTVESYFRIDGEDNTFTSVTEDSNESNAYDDVVANLKTARISYVSMPRDGVKLIDSVQRIRDANVGSKAAVDRMFGSEKAARMAGTSPVKFTQKYAKGTRQVITKEQRAVIQETMNTPHTVIPEMMQLASQIGRDAMLQIAGFIDLESAALHDHNKDSAEAQNMNLENQYDAMWEMLTSHEYGQEFYVEQSVWKNFRAGFMNQSLNQQTSKIHRFMFQRPGWSTTIKLADTEMVNEFKIAVAMSLGLKTDQQLNVTTLEQFNQVLKDKPEIMQAVEVIRMGVLNDATSVWTDEAKKLVADVAGNREGMMSLQALMAMAKYQEALIEHGLVTSRGGSADTSFDVTLLVGVDGKTNGPMLSHLALGAADNIDDFYVLLNRGGFYSTEEDQPDHFSAWYTRLGSMDLYEDLGSRILDRVKSLMVPQRELDAMRKDKDWKNFFKHFTAEQMNAVELVTKQLMDPATMKATKNMRNLTKVPLTSFAFGSSLGKSVMNMKTGFVESYYSNLQDMAASGANGESVKAYIKAINLLIDMGNYELKSPVNPNLPIEQLLKLELTPAQEMALHKAFDRVIGASVKAEMESYFSTFIERRTMLNNTIQSSYAVFEAAYASARIKEMERLMDTGEVASRMSKKDGVEFRMPLHDMTVAQDNALRDKLSSLMPVMHTAYSIRDNNIGAGLFMAKSKTNISQSPLYASKVHTYRPVQQSNGTQKPFLASKAQTRIEQSPGVAGAAYSIHSTDSSIMHQLLGRVKGTLNVHDEGSNGVHKTKDVAAGLNRATAENLLNYSPARESLLMLERMITNMAKQVRAGVVDEQAVWMMFDSWAAEYNKFNEEDPVPHELVANLILQDAAQNAFRADYMRLSAFTKLKSVDQYVWEGGQFNDAAAMEKIRAEAQTKLDNLQAKAGSGAVKDLAYLQTIFAKVEDQPIILPTWIDMKIGNEDKYATNKIVAPTQTAAKTSAIAELGKSIAASDPKLVKAFEAKPVMTLAEVLSTLDGIVTDDFSKKLIGQLKRTVKADLKIKYVTAATVESDLQHMPTAENAAGWYSLDPVTGAQEIYVKSPEFKYSMVSAEVLLHELTHAALVNIVQYEQDQRDAGAPATAASALIEELESLMELARQRIEESGSEELQKTFAAPVSNLHEFIAYGMTNKAFQDNILSAIGMTTKTAGNPLVTAMKAFINALSKLIFRSANSSMSSGMEIMVQNVAGLMQHMSEVHTEIGSNSGTKITLAAQPINNVRDLSTLDIYNALAASNNGATVSTAHGEHLKGLLSTMVKSIYGPFGSFKDVMMAQTAKDPVDVYTEALQTGVAPFASESLSAGFQFTDQEAFVLEQVEASIRTALESNDGVMTIAYKELTRLYNEVRDKLTVESFHKGDWATATQIEKDQAQALHDFIFNIKQLPSGKSDYLSRFAALGMVHEGFRAQLGFHTSTKAADRELSFNERLNKVFNTIMSWIAGRMTDTFGGQRADAKLTSLVQQMIQIEAKRKAKAEQGGNLMLAGMSATAGDLGNKARAGLEAFGKKPFFQTSSNQFLKLGGNLISAVAGDRVDAIMEGLMRLRDATMTGQLGLAASLLNEVRGATDLNKVYHYLLRGTKHLEGIRKDTISNISKAMSGSFAKGGDYLTAEHKKAMTAVVLRGDMQSLLGPYSIADLAKMVGSRTHLNAEITKLESQLATSGPMNRFYLNSAKALGFFMATSRVTVAHQLFNAGNIARVLGTGMEKRVSEAQAKTAEPVIDRLASLYAIRYSSNEDLRLLSEVFTTEAARTDKGNGIEMIMKTHTALQSESKQSLFADSEALVMKGYVPEIYDPYMSVVMAGDVEGADLIKKGYTAMPGYLGQDPADPSAELKRIYSLRDGGMKQWNSGIISTTDNHRKGNSVDAAGQQNSANMSAIKAGKRAGIQAMFTGTNFDPTKVKTTHMAPVMNATGGVANYRYMMSNNVKDALLNRDNRTDHLLGSLAGTTFDKVASKKQNRDAMKALHEQYLQDFAVNPNTYLVVGPNSTDPQLRELWAMLPRDTREYAKELFGKDGIKIRNDVLDMNFGYRKLSIGSSFDKEESQRSFVENMFVEIMNAGFGEKAQLRARQFEDIWQAIVKETKANLVVKSWSTMSGNLRSNWSQLFLMGVSPMKILNGHRVAFKAAWEYKQDSAKLFALQHQVKVQHFEPGMDGAKAAYLIKRLEDSLARNPIRPLIDAGLMPTIVEDVGVDEDIYSYKSRFTEKIDGAIDNVNPHILKATRLLTMHHSTAPYKIMSYATQISDFLARYTLYQHDIQTMSHEQAVQRASEAFINYDVPTHRMMQYANDSGLIMFSKYYVRIQKVLGRIYKDAPGRVMALLAAEHMLGDQPTVLDSGFTHRFGNPFNAGALSYLGSLDSVTTVGIITSPFTTAVYNGQ